MLLRGKVLFSLTVIILLMLTGCLKGEQSQKEIDAPTNVEEVGKATSNDTNKNDEEGEENGDVNENAESDEDQSTSETVMRELYLLDVNGMVASQMIELPIPESKEVATQVLEYLVKEGPITNIIPNGFQAVLPAGTEVISLNLQEDGTLIVDLSDEFTNYKADEEVKILEAMTYTLTQFDSVDRMKLKINGHTQDEMPVDGTPISEGYSRAKGINYAKTNTIDLISSEAVTMYYPSEYNDNHYYVPVTQHVKAIDDDIYSAIVSSLIDGPGYDVNVTHVFNDQTILAKSPSLDDGVLELVFTEDILKDAEQAIISDSVMETLVRTLTDQRNIEAIDVKVENVEKIVNEQGEMYTEPVTTSMFNPNEKI